MAFVPEGQADSSQARSAWVAMQRGPVPQGRSKSWSVPQIFVVETEPRHEQATARRMLMPLQKRQVFLLKSSGPMTFDLILDGMNGFRQLRDAHAESAITLLPAKVFERSPIARYIRLLAPARLSAACWIDTRSAAILLIGLTRRASDSRRALDSRRESD